MFNETLTLLSTNLAATQLLPRTELIIFLKNGDYK
jgi:hypothetical protein